MKFSSLLLVGIVSAIPGYNPGQQRDNRGMSNEEGGYEYDNMEEPSGMQGNEEGDYEDFNEDEPYSMRSNIGPFNGSRRPNRSRRPQRNNGNNWNQVSQGGGNGQGDNGNNGGGDGLNGQGSINTSNPTPSTGGDQGSAGDEQSLAQVNAVRARVGAPPLKLSSKLKIAAQKHSEYQAQTGKMDHSGSGGSSPTQRINAAGVKGLQTGENVAFNQPSMAAAIQAWVKSPGHYRNLVDKGFKYVAFGEKNKYYTQDFSSSD